MKTWMKATCGLAGAALLLGHAQAAEMKALTVAEPVHSVGYLPLYVAVHKDYFKEEGLDVKVITVESGSGHTNAVLSGQAFAFIGGPEHDAFAKIKGAELRSVVNVVDRGNVYFVAAKGMAPKDGDLAGFFKGKTVATQFLGGTPNSITRYLLAKLKLDPKSDLKLIETSNGAVISTIKAGQAQIGVVAEPAVTQGEKQNIWGEPFYNVPKELGPYAYSTLNIRQASIEKEPETVQGFVRAVVKGLKETYANPAEAAEIARKEFPTMSADDLKATIDRSFKDEVWSHDGMVSKASWATGKSVVMEAGILKQDVPYEAIIDMSFVEKTKTAAK